MTYQLIVQAPIGKEKVTLPFQENITNWVSNISLHSSKISLELVLKIFFRLGKIGMAKQDAVHGLLLFIEWPVVWHIDILFP